MASTRTEGTHTGVTQEAFKAQYRSPGGATIEVPVEAGIACIRLDDPQGGRWVLNDDAYVNRTMGSFYGSEAEHYGVPVPEKHVGQIEPVAAPAARRGMRM
ncbi:MULTISPECIES: hypothetical protein [unclassified Thioalkalivibrio]|uniref:hypothetical protein n=1 Tax=unclassified Thioalkalivibrio TaxID=2621013 RepID=UPI00035F4A51|nr:MULTISPECIES: hypothetical protein [unclassified Thioalkalivibrio]